MNSNEAVASDIAAPAASETAAQPAGQESVGFGHAGPDGLHVPDRLLREYRFWHATKVQGVDFVKKSHRIPSWLHPGSPAMAGPHFKHPSWPHPVPGNIAVAGSRTKTSFSPVAAGTRTNKTY